MTRSPRRADSTSPYVLSPLRDFLRTEAAGGILLAASAVAALIWANSPWSKSYATLWDTQVSIGVGRHIVALSLRHWVNEGLITIFFFVVGLEIKREVVSGQLATRRAALLPIIAALGGMALPALIYLAIAGETSARGWAIVVATDIPLALGVVAIAGDRVPPSQRIFLLAVAIVDDIGSLLIIAAFYSTGVGWAWLLGACLLFGAAVVAKVLGVRQYWVFVAVGCLMWWTLHEAGVSATLVGVAMGLLAPSTPRITAEFVDVEELADVSSVEAARTTTDIARGSISVVEWLEHVLHPWTSYAIIPLFALANTGIALTGELLREAFHSPVTWAIIVARVAGKPLGIVIASRSTIAAGIADRPAGSTTRQAVGVATSAGMGFTVALFIAELAFTDSTRRSNATIGIIVAAILAGAVSLSILALRPSPATAVG
jgi:Na+:H+ antiporter, NhaA family